MAMSFPYRHGVFPPNQQRGSEQLEPVNASSKGNSLPTGILARPHSQRSAFSQEALHHRVLRTAHRYKHCLETAPVVRQERVYCAVRERSFLILIRCCHR